MENTSSFVVENATYSDVDMHTSMPVFKIVFTLILVVIMFGMGCAVELQKLIENLKRPIGIAIGLVCQIIFMPVFTYALIKISGMSIIQAIAFMLVGCSPGGSNSNVITYLIKGDISLSVAMTSFSNILALGTVPFFVFVFTTLEHVDDSLQIPYWSLAVTLGSIGVPLSLGIVFRYKFPRRSKIFPKICSGIAIVMLITTIISLVVVTKMPFVFSANTILPVGLLPLVGMAFSYAICWIPQLKLTGGAKKAIAIETAIQNGGLANSVIMLTFGDRLGLMGQAITIPLIYNVAQSVYVLLIVAIYRCWLCRKAQPTGNVPLDDDVKDDSGKQILHPPEADL